MPKRNWAARMNAPFPYGDAEAMSSQTTEVCEEKKRLNLALENAATEYSVTLRGLSAQMAVVPKGVYDQLRSRADALRLKSESARLALERHIAEHGC